MNNKIIFSIIIPTYNRPEQLTSCLEAIALLSYPHDCFEVIVVDDGSKTPLNGVVALFRNKINIQLLRQENAGPATARNRGTAVAKGEFLAFTDDDCQPTPDWLDRFAEGFARDSEAMLGGKTINALDNNPFSTASQKLIDYIYDYQNLVKSKDAFFSSNNIAVPTTNFKALNGFSTSYPFASEDRDFCDRWSQVYPSVYIPQAQVYHYHRLNLITFCQQQFSYGRGGFRFHRTRASRNAERIKLQSRSFYLDLLLYPFSQATKQSKFLIFCLFLISQIAITVGFFWEKSNFKVIKTV